MDNREATGRFITYFKNQLTEIQKLETQHSRLYRNLLYATILDALAKSVLPRRAGNKDRFVYYIKRFGRWPDAERVSLAHLDQLLKKNPDPAFEQLRRWASEKFRKQSVHRSELMPISHDPEAEDVNKFWPTQKEHKIPLEGIDLQSLQHCQLLYTYRNSLVHELRIPGHGMEFGDDIEPFYHLASTFGPNQEIEVTSVELVYPWRFLHSLCDRSLESLKEYFIANDLNPYDSFTFGTYWLDELNR